MYHHWQELSVTIIIIVMYFQKRSPYPPQEAMLNLQCGFAPAQIQNGNGLIKSIL